MKAIPIKGTIVSDNDVQVYRWFGYDVTAPSDVKLEDSSEDITVEINSPGGDISAGAEIYTKLRSYSGRVNVNIVGVAASAASFIAMAGDHIAISPMAQMMIHNASATSSGNANDHYHLGTVLEGVSDQIAESYAKRTGKSVDAFKALMDKETYFTAKQAVEQGLADEIMFEDDEAPVLAAGFGVLPNNVLNKARQVMNKDDKQAIATVNVDINDELKTEIQDLKNEINKLVESDGNKPRFLF